MDIREFVAQLKKIKRQGEGYLACCPAHDDKTPSLSIKESIDGKILIHCFAGCDTTSILSAMGLAEQDLFLKPPSSPSKGKNLVTRYAYEDAFGNLQYEVCRYTPKDFRIQRIEQGQRKWGLGTVNPILYKLPNIVTAIQAKQPIFICEGEKDADTLTALHYTATTAPLGAGKWRDSYTSELQGAIHIIILPDCDKPGRQHAITVAEKLIKQGLRVSLADLQQLAPSLPEKADITDYLQQAGSMSVLLENLMTLDTFKEYYTSPVVSLDTEAIPLNIYLQTSFWTQYQLHGGLPHLTTGFTSLDKLLGYTLPSGLYILGAVSSLGKSAFCSQIFDNFATQQQHVLFISLEMSTFEMTSRTIIRYLFQKNPDIIQPYVTGQLLRGEIPRPAIEAIIQTDMADMSPYLTYMEGNFSIGVSQIRAVCESYIKNTNTRPVVCIDYLQVLTPPEIRLTDKQAMDQNVVALKRMSRDLNIPIWAVSSLNRQNYNDELSFSAFKESGAIEYSADFVMGLQAAGVSEAAANLQWDEKKMTRQVAQKVKEVKRQTPRLLEAVILKNRRGEATGRFGLKYWPGQNFFEEG